MVTLAAGLVAALIGVIDLGGIISGFSAFSEAASGFYAIKFATAVGTLLAGVALALQFRPFLWMLKAYVVMAAAMGTILAGTALLVEMLSGRGFHLQFSPAVPLLLTGVSLAALEVSFKRHPVSHIIALVVLFLSLLPLIGFLYGGTLESGISEYFRMAPQTALALGLLAVGIMTSRIDHDFVAILFSKGPGGFMARRLILVSTMVPLSIGFLEVGGEVRHFFTMQFGTAGYTTLMIAVIVGVIWQQSLQLQRIELARMEAFEEREALRIASQLRDQFVAMLSHDLRNPLASVQLTAQILARRADCSEGCRKDAEKIKRIISGADAMIQDLLDASRVRAGQPFPIRPQSCRLAPVLEHLVSDLRAMHGDRFLLKMSSQGIEGQWDVSAIRRAVENLATNALKYGKKEGLISLTVSDSSDAILISVHNQGNPISKEDQMKLFDPFVRVTKIPSNGIQGWGIGLAVVKGVAEAHGGSVSVESTQELGTTFILKLPRRL
jgi:signal transduction histidine kinase